MRRGNRKGISFLKCKFPIPIAQRRNLRFGDKKHIILIINISAGDISGTGSNIAIAQTSILIGMIHKFWM
jgi:hypothetical protein